LIMKLKVFVFMAMMLVRPVFAVTHLELGPSDRTRLSLTVFNTNLAVIRDYRRLVLPTGDIELEFTDVAISILAPTVTMSSDHAKGFVANRQNYRFDLLNRQSLLERFIGRKVKYSRTILENGTFEKLLREGILLSIDPEIVKFGDVIEVAPEGTVSLPYIPSDLKTKPTLVFNGENRKKGTQNIHVRYHASGISWEADYVLTLETLGSLDGWVSIRNDSGTDFMVDELRLVAGELHRNSNNVRPMAESARMARMDFNVAVKSEVGEYHAYDFPGKVRLNKNDQTQIRLLTAQKIQTKKSYRLISPVHRYGNQPVQESSPSVWISFDNSRKNNLSEPLPAGNIRVYERQGSRETFIGESRIQHTPVNNEIKLEIGKAFDVRARRTQTAFRKLGARTAEVGYSIDVRSAKKHDINVMLEEKMSGDWQIVEQSQIGTRLDAATYSFDLKVPAGKTAKIDYVVRFSW